MSGTGPAGSSGRWSCYENASTGCSLERVSDVRWYAERGEMEQTRQRHSGYLVAVDCLDECCKRNWPPASAFNESEAHREALSSGEHCQFMLNGLHLAVGYQQRPVQVSEQQRSPVVIAATAQQPRRGSPSTCRQHQIQSLARW